jgi:antitoxin FitA
MRAAAQHGRSAEAEIRDILERVVKPAKRVRLGNALAALGRKVGLTDEDIAAIDQMRDKSSTEPMKFGRLGDVIRPSVEKSDSPVSWPPVAGHPQF